MHAFSNSWPIKCLRVITRMLGHEGRFHLGGADPSRSRGITSYSDPSSTFDLRANQQVFCFLVDLQPEGL